MKIREVVFRFLTDYASNIPSGAVIRPRKIYSALKDARARVLADALPNVSEHNYYTLPCVPLVETTAHECGCIPVDGCKYYKTACTLPQTITKDRSLISDITTLDGNIRFSQIAWDQVKYTQYDKYTSKDPKYFIRNDQVFLINVPKRLEVISIRGLFDDTIFSDTCFECSQDCKSALDHEFPIDRKYIPRIFQITLYLLGYGGTITNEQLQTLQTEGRDAREGRSS